VITHAYYRRRGGGLIVALVTLLVVMVMTGAIIRTLITDFRETRQAANELQAQWLADAALARAAIQLQSNSGYTSEIWKPTINDNADADTGVAEIRVERNNESSRPDQLIVSARYPDHPWRRVSVSRSLRIPQETTP
jgi:type II secretory pathway component PulK